MDEIALGSKIYELRKKLKLTQVQLAEMVGVSGAAISHFEKGTSKPGFETLEKISRALGFDSSEFYVESKGGSTEEAEMYRSYINALNAFRGRPKGKLSGFKRVVQIPFEKEEYIYLNIYTSREFVDHILDPLPSDEHTFNKPKVGVLPLPGIDYSLATVIEIQGSSMAPRYTENSRHVLFEVGEEHWQYSMGVHAIWLKAKMLLVKRIVSNKEGVITLRSDATGDQTTVEIVDIVSLWRMGQAIHLPPEEL